MEQAPTEVPANTSNVVEDAEMEETPNQEVEKADETVASVSQDQEMKTEDSTKAQ